jgi:DNA repair protein RadC
MEETNYSIKSWALEDRPRDKYLSKGVDSLTDAELIAILLRSGYKEKSALEVSKALLKAVSNDLDQLARLSVKDMTRFKGIGEVKAVTLQVAFEIARRRKISEKNVSEIKKSEDVFYLLGPKLSDLTVEEFHIILLNKKNTIITTCNISKGGTAATIVDAKVIFKKAIDFLATAIILVHNHPSGNRLPSSADIDITKRLKTFGELIDVTILDHIIIAKDKYFSFADENLL